MKSKNKLIKNPIIKFYERGRKGWSRYDCWNLDSYLLTVMASSVEHFAKTTHTWPASDIWKTYEDWQNYLFDIANQLKALEPLKNEFDPKYHAQLTKVLSEFPKFWSDLWD